MSKHNLSLHLNQVTLNATSGKAQIFNQTSAMNLYIDVSGKASSLRGKNFLAQLINWVFFFSNSGASISSF